MAFPAGPTPSLPPEKRDKCTNDSRLRALWPKPGTADRPGAAVEARLSCATYQGMTTPPIHELTDRARDVFRIVVDSYLETGVPVGSRTIASVCAMGAFTLVPDM